MSDVLAEDDFPAPAPSRWVPHGPEQRLSVTVDRFLTQALCVPFYITANHDADGGGRTNNQRKRDADRGIKPGVIDWEIEQGPPHLMRRLELKRGKNDLTNAQKVTVKILTSIGARPVAAWTLREAYEGLREAGFRFVPNVETLLQKFEASLSAKDREAELIRTGAVTRKPAKKRKVEPRFLMTRSSVKRANKAGILV